MRELNNNVVHRVTPRQLPRVHLNTVVTVARQETDVRLQNNNPHLCGINRNSHQTTLVNVSITAAPVKSSSHILAGAA